MLRIFSCTVAVTIGLSITAHAAASDENTAPLDAKAPGLFEPGSAEHAFAAIESAIGRKFDVIGVRITPSELLVDAITDDAKREVETWQFSHVADFLFVSAVTVLRAPS